MWFELKFERKEIENYVEKTQSVSLARALKEKVALEPVRQRYVFSNSIFYYLPHSRSLYHSEPCGIT
jgi:hypothetical protein